MTGKERREGEEWGGELLVFSQSMAHHNTHKTSLLVWVELANTQLITDGVKYYCHGRQSDTIWQPNVIHSETLYPYSTLNTDCKIAHHHTHTQCTGCWLSYQHAQYTSTCVGHMTINWPQSWQVWWQGSVYRYYGISTISVSGEVRVLKWEI